MDFKDYDAALGVQPTATHDNIKRAYRQLARKYHPDVSKEPDAEARFKEVAEAHEALIDTERRAAYDAMAQQHAAGLAFHARPGGAGAAFTGRGAQGFAGHDGADFSDFFESLFGRGAHADRHVNAHAQAGPGHGGPAWPHADEPVQGADHHAKLFIDLRDSCLGAQRTVTLRVPVDNAAGHATLQDRQFDVRIPAGVRQGQHLRLSGQGAAGLAGGPAGDLYLELQFKPHPVFRVDGRSVHFDLPIAPWEAALGAVVAVPTPDGSVVQLRIPPGSAQGRTLRLKGKGLPGGGNDKQPGDLHAVVRIALPAADTQPAKDAYTAFAAAFAGGFVGGFVGANAPDNPRAALEALCPQPTTA